ncbi:MAG: class I SAM-dependent methyltransferase [Planctomycetes bacterium]|nr:class I SAM-dependent methyltransferase [Planctomycetota bacterium]
MNTFDFAELGLIPDALIRFGIRRLLARRLASLSEQGTEQMVQLLRASPLAVDTDAANRQHYEVLAEFFQQVLGPRLKYSCCLFTPECTTLEEAERRMLDETCQRAEIRDGMRILELGCGWGSLTLWIASRYPASRVTAVSNSQSQRAFIEKQAEEAGLQNLRVITADMREFETSERFDRVVSVEMFEHMRNYELLFARVSSWLTDQGKAFLHVFCHRTTPYLFEDEANDDWMARHFFTGGTMPSLDLFREFDRHLTVSRQWAVNGMHYWQTCEQWLRNLDRNRGQIRRLFERDLSSAEARRTLQRWRIFLMACAELFRYKGGNAWLVGHYLLEPVRGENAWLAVRSRRHEAWMPSAI